MEPSPHTPLRGDDCYREKYVAFIDMLGFGQRVLATSDDSEQRTLIIDNIEHLRATVGSDAEAGTFVTYFSDCIVVSAEVDLSGLGLLFRAIGHIADNLIQRDVLIRGAVTRGGIYHDDDLCFGPAMVKAYLLESKEAHDPVILLQPEVYRDAEQYGFEAFGLIMADTDVPDRCYLNYLHAYTSYDGVPYNGMVVRDEPAALIRHTIARRLADPDPRVQKKGAWMKRYWDENVAINGFFPRIDVELDLSRPDARPSTIRIRKLSRS